MKKIKTFLWKLFCPFANEVWWPMWSNIRWKKVLKQCEVRKEDRANTLVDIKILVKKLYSKFKWTSDDITELYDSITPPAQNYSNYLRGQLLDDCDGFHSLVYHCLQASGIQCYLMTAISINGGHCILVFNYKDKWYVNDYSKVYDGCDTLKEAIKNYNEAYTRIYDKGVGEVVYNGFVAYNYQTGKFKSIKKELLSMLE